MERFAADVHTFVSLVVAGETLEAMERFYADDVELFENYDPPRVGKAFNLEHERKNLAALSGPMRAEARAVAVDAQAGVSMVEWAITFTFAGRAPQRLEEVAVQRWRDGKIVSERFYWQRFVAA
jgi:ketosteroid isomerase-like protein